MRRFAPDACVGTGGYVAGPVVLAAALLGVPTVIQEQNALPGLTNRILVHFVDKVAWDTKRRPEVFGGGTSSFLPEIPSVPKSPR